MSFLKPFAEPLGTAAALFPLVALVLLVPFAVLHYHRHGHVHPWRALVTYGFVFYLIAATFLVLLPLPDRPSGADTAAWLEAHQGLDPQWDPTAAFREIRGPSGGLRMGALLQVVFNVLLLAPLGAFLAYTRGWGLGGALAGGLAMSLGFEVAQVTGLFWYYPGPYRLFDTSDLVLNTLGSGLGALLARGALRLGLPPLNALQGPATPWIGPFRRGLAVGFDLLAAGVTALVLMAVPGADWAGGLSALGLAAWLVVVPAVDGRGLGKRLTLCGVRLKNGRNARGRVLVRQLALWGVPVALGGLSALNLGTMGPWLVLAGLVWAGAFGLHGFQVVFDPEHASWVDRRLGTRVRNLWKAPPGSAEPKPGTDRPRPAGSRPRRRSGRPRS